MDFLRSHHLTLAQVTSDSTSQTWLRWYPTAPGARAYPGWHAFGDPVWCSDFPTPDGVGCYPSPLIWRGKRYFAAPGLHYRGEPSWFENGIPSADLSTPPIADTCSAPAISAQGGSLVGGSAWSISPNPSPVALMGTVSSTPPQLPGYQYVSARHNSQPSSQQSISGYQPSAVCMCASPSMSITYMITSCMKYNILAGSVNDLALPVTQTPFTKYDLTAFAGGSTITGIVPQSLQWGPQSVTLFNLGSDPVIVQGSSASSQLANRIILPPAYGSSVTLAQGDSITLVYNPCNPQPQWVTQSCTVDVDYSLAQILTYVEANYTPSLTAIESVLESGSAILSTTMGDVGVSVTLAVGTWVIVAEYDWGLSGVTGTDSVTIEGQLYNSTIAAAVTNTYAHILAYSNLTPDQEIFGHSTISTVVDVVGESQTFNMQAQSGTSSPSISVFLQGDAAANESPTRMLAIKIG